MKMFNGELQQFIEFLYTLDLPGRDSRNRTRFAKLIGERLKEIEDERINLIQKYCERDEKEQPVVINNEENKSTYKIKDMKSFEKDYKELLEEEFVLDNTEERKNMLLSIKDSVLNTNKTFSGIDALRYERWCEIVEEIEYK